MSTFSDVSPTSPFSAQTQVKRHRCHRLEHIENPQKMENPTKEIADVIHLLTQSPPSTQRQTIDKYFTSDASFTHPFCRTGKWPNSRLLVQIIYRWYKIMSPNIDITVQSVGTYRPYIHPDTRG